MPLRPGGWGTQLLGRIVETKRPGPGCECSLGMNTDPSLSGERAASFLSARDRTEPASTPEWVRVRGERGRNATHPHDGADNRRQKCLDAQCGMNKHSKSLAVGGPRPPLSPSILCMVVCVLILLLLLFSSPPSSPGLKFPFSLWRLQPAQPDLRNTPGCLFPPNESILSDTKSKTSNHT